MAEDLAIVHTQGFAPGDSTAAVASIAACLSAAGAAGYWAVDPSVAVGAGELALLATAQGYGVADDQRIAIRAQASGVIQFGYAPDGWAITSLADLDTTPPAAWSGWRNITGTATGIGATIVRVWVAQYRDQFDSATAPDPASSLCVIVGSSSTWNHGAHLGRVLSTDNASDSSNGIVGDALFVGTPTAVAATVGGWLRGANTSNPANASVIRTGATWWSYARIADDLRAAALADIEQARRVVPLNLYGHGNAKPVGDDATHAGVIGQCKYLRRHRTTVGFGAYLQSIGSAQRWTAVVPSTADTDHIILWASATEVP